MNVQQFLDEFYTNCDDVSKPCTSSWPKKVPNPAQFSMLKTFQSHIGIQHQREVIVFGTLLSVKKHQQ